MHMPTASHNGNDNVCVAFVGFYQMYYILQLCAIMDSLGSQLYPFFCIHFGQMRDPVPKIDKYMYSIFRCATPCIGDLVGLSSTSSTRSLSRGDQSEPLVPFA